MVVKKHCVLPSLENYRPGGRVTWVMYTFIFISTSVFLLSLHTVTGHNTEESFSKISITTLNENDVNSQDRCSGFKDSDRFDCFPQQNVSEDTCKNRGCCWIPSSKSSKDGLGIPYCFYPSKFRSYRYLNISSTDKGKTAYLEKVVSSPYPGDIQLVKIDFNYIDENVLQVKVSLVHYPDSKGVIINVYDYKHG
jgi:hypothetical protein